MFPRNVCSEISEQGIESLTIMHAQPSRFPNQEVDFYRQEPSVAVPDRPLLSLLAYIKSSRPSPFCGREKRHKVQSGVSTMLTFTRSKDAETEENPGFISRFISWPPDSSKAEFESKPDSWSDSESIDSCQSPRPCPPHSRAWIKGVVVCSWIIAFVLCINILLTIVAAGLAYSKNGETNPSFAAIYKGKCQLARNWTTGLHLAINILSTIMLGASNYCMQCLVSPSRAEADEAHSKRRWVSIGIPNILDLIWRQRGKRQVLGWTLLVTSLPVHLMFVSTLFTIFMMSYWH